MTWDKEQAGDVAARSALNLIACGRAINGYLNAQEAKGLIEDTEQGWGPAHRPDYETHWGTHIEVILPEVKRIAADYGLQIRMTSLKWMRADGWSATMDPQLYPVMESKTFLKRTVWVYISLSIDAY